MEKIRFHMLDLSNSAISQRRPTTGLPGRASRLICLLLTMVGCKTYRAITHDGGDALALDGGSESAAVDTTEDRLASSDAISNSDAPADIVNGGPADAASDPGAFLDVASDALGDTSSDSPSSPDSSGIAAPRLISPLSTATVTSRRPLLRWALADGSDGARIEICRDRMCASPVVGFDADGVSGAPLVDLPTGVLFWRAHGRSRGSTGTTSTPVWQFWVGSRSALVNTSWGTTSDVNGDGYPDALVGAYGSGRAYVYLGGPSGFSSTTQPITLMGSASVPNSAFGRAIFSAGDTNGDGYPDVIVEDFGSNAYMFQGTPSGLGPAQQMSLTGTGLVPVGDINGDGYADVVAIGLENLALPYFGSPLGLVPSPQPVSLAAQGLAAVGDVNGDGYADVAVGFTVYLGDPSGAFVQRPVVLSPPAGAGTTLPVGSAGDTNGDGYADIIIQELVPTGVGKAYLYLGGGAPTLATRQAIIFTSPGGTADGFGSPATGAGDVNGDGYGDIAIGASLTGDRTGRVYVYLGTAGTPVPTQQPTILNGPDGPNGDFGAALAGLGDVNGDGYADIIVGAFEVLSCIGRTYIYRGGSGGISSSQQPIVFTGPDGVDGNFGNSVGLR